MTINFYQGDVAKLSDAELTQLEEELCGVDDEYASPGDWEYQAAYRQGELRSEMRRRWELAHPEEAERAHKYQRPIAAILSQQIEAMRPKLSELFTHSQEISKILRTR